MVHTVRKDSIGGEAVGHFKDAVSEAAVHWLLIR